MPAPHKPTFEQVSQIAQEIKQQGRRPSVRDIKKRLGGNPSPSAILTHLMAWREDNDPDPEPYLESKEWEDITRRTAERVWNEAVTAARKEVAKEIQTLKQENKKLRSRIIDLELEIAQ